MNILIIDDSDTSRLLLESVLRKAGYSSILQAKSAGEGLKLLAEGNADKPEVDLILMDLMMPDMNGIQATRRIKHIPQLKDIPVVIVTANEQAEKLEQAFEAGVTDYINKPVHKLELRARVRAALKLKEEMDRRKNREQELLQLTAALTQANAKLEEIANLDGLTGVPNRRFVDAAMKKECERALRDKYPVSVLMIDVDYFKSYNDTYGHQEGDACLQKIANILSDAARRPADVCGRFGGEEFVLLLPGTDSDGALEVTEYIRKKLKELNIEHAASDVSGRVTVSVGVATATRRDYLKPEWLVHASDTALYQAKDDGRNTVRLYKEPG